MRKKNYGFFIHSLTVSWKKSGLSSNVLSKDCQNSNLPVQWEEEGFFSVKGKFQTFSDIQPKPVGHWSQSSRRGCQNWIQHKQRIMAKEKLLFPRSYTVFYQIPTLSEKLPPFLQGTFFGFVKKLHSHRQKNSLQLNYSEKKDFLILIRRRL